MTVLGHVEFINYIKRASHIVLRENICDEDFFCLSKKILNGAQIKETDATAGNFLERLYSFCVGITTSQTRINKNYCISFKCSKHIVIRVLKLF